MPRGEHLKGKPSQNPAARSVLHRGVTDGRFLEGQDRRRTKRYWYEESPEHPYQKHRSSSVALDGNVPVASFEEWLVGKLDKQGVADTLRLKEARRNKLNAAAKLFWEYVEESQKNGRN